MGCCASAKGAMDQTALAPNEKEIAIKSYKSSNDSIFEKIEKSNNILTYISLLEFINNLEQYKPENATIPFEGVFQTNFSSSDEFLNEKINKDEFQSMIENKLLKIKDVYDLANKNSEITGIFKATMLEMYDSILLKLNQHYGDNDLTRINKRNLAVFGFLFCQSNNISKIKLFFDLFKGENGNFTKNANLDDYLLTAFIASSYSMVAARKKISSSSKIPPLSKDELIKALNVSELKDSEKLLEVFNDNFFSEQQAYTWDEFKNKFQEPNGFGWIFSTKGIRCKLEENNV